MLQIDPPCTYLNNDSQRGETGLSATRLDSLDPAPLSILPVIGRKDGSFFLFSFFSFVFRPAPSRSIKIRPVSRDVDAFSEAGWALPVRPGERGGIPHRRRVRETRGRARAIPMRTPAQVLSALAAIALSHGAKVHVAPRRITIVLCCASPLLFPLLLPPPPSSSSSLPTLLSPLLLPCIFLLYFSLSFSFPLLRVPFHRACVQVCILLRRLLTLVCFHAL